MSQPVHGNFHDDVQDDHEYLDSSVEILMMKIMSNAHSHSSGFGHLSSLEVIFFILKNALFHDIGFFGSLFYIVISFSFLSFSPALGVHFIEALHFRSIWSKFLNWPATTTTNAPTYFCLEGGT